MKTFVCRPFPLLLIMLLGAGCASITSLQIIGDADEAMDAGEKAFENDEYTEAYRSYLKAEAFLKPLRSFSLDKFASAREYERLQRDMSELKEEAKKKGLLQVDDSFLQEAELGDAVAGVIKEVVKHNRVASFPSERIVGEATEAAAKKTPDGKYDITLNLVLRDTGETGGFSQDAWASVRYILQGAFGNGFSYYLMYAFPTRPWFRMEAFWGGSDKPGAENRFVGLEDKIERLTVNIYRGHYRKEAPARYDRYGFESLEAVGPYWEKEFFKSYTLDRAEAVKYNWDKPDLIPDAALYGVLKIGKVEH